MLLLAMAACSLEHGLNPKPDAAEGDDTAESPPVDTSGLDTAPTPTCDDFAAPALPEPPQDAACVLPPTVGTFSPVVEWLWDVNPGAPGYDQVMSTPVVGNLSDDNADGVIDARDVPDIAFTAYAGSAYSSAGTLNVISGDGSGTRWSIQNAGGHGFYGSGGVAIGDLEGDGSPDVCAASTSGGVVCVEAEGRFKWQGGSDNDPYGFPSIADMDGDGSAEVIWGRQILDATGALVGTGAYGRGSNGGYAAASFAVDVDGDGLLEVVAGNAVYERDGTTLWYDAGLDGWPAVGDFDGDGAPEIVRVADGTVILSDTDGTPIWSVAVPGSGGGPPTVADFDGDGAPEIGVAGLSLYSVIETDGTVRWSAVTQDASSARTGSSVFDFEGDGDFEVVYADEHTLWIYAGADGAVLMAATDHASGTLFEYPIIADVDGDDSTEIVVGSNDMWWTGWNGITVIGDADGSWSAARPIWNQHAYHITNVEDDGSIPAVQAENWDTWNNFRAGGAEEGPAHWLPDLAPGDPDVCLLECDAGTVTFYVPVVNTGLAAGIVFDVVVTRSDGTEVWTDTIATLDAGEAEMLGPVTLSMEQWGPDSPTLSVDGDGRVDECDEVDNVVELGRWPCE